MSDETSKADRSFSCFQLRFFVAFILLLAAGLKAYQIATGPLPPSVQGSIFTPLLELFNNRYLLMTVVVGEIFFALLLVAGLWRQWTWFLSVVGFSVFTIVSFMKGLSGESSCGCFGTVAINPWITTSFDLTVVALLLCFRERSAFTFIFSSTERKKLRAVLLVWLCISVPALLAMLSLKHDIHATLGSTLTDATGQVKIVLEPETWIGKEFSLFSRFVQPSDHRPLKEGAWQVLLVHVDCPKCAQILADLKSTREKIAVLVIPSDAPNGLPPTTFPSFTLDDENDWFVMTPQVVLIKDGICVSVSETLAVE